MMYLLILTIKFGAPEKVEGDNIGMEAYKKEAFFYKKQAV